MEKLKSKYEKKKEKPDGIVKKTTHLHLEEKALPTIRKIVSENLEVLYLYNNCIQEIINLDKLPNLTSIYLQNNQIEKLENLKYLTNLRRLFIGQNRIRVLEGLECLENLEELHIQRQTLPEEDSFCFDPRTILGIARSLRVLNISHNKITTLQYLQPLRLLETIDASSNDLDNISEVSSVLRNWYYLRKANFIGNPLTKKHRYRESLIANCYHLDFLDEKLVSETTRNFIKRFEEERLTGRCKTAVNLADMIPGLPKNYSHSLQKAVSASILRNNKLAEDLSTFDEKNAVYIPWNKLPSRPLPKPRIPKLSMNTRKNNLKGFVVKNIP